MRKLITVAVSIFSVLSLTAGAHEGHDHGPGKVPLQKGGVMRSLETVNLELVYSNNSIQIYPFETKQDPKNPGKLKSAELAKFPVTATIELPKSKPQKLELKQSGDHWEAFVDSKGAHRFTVLLAITQGGHNDKVKWTIEPKH